MIIGIMTLGIHIPWSHSLKEKRSEAAKIKRRVQNKFNVSIIESDHQNLPQTITLSVAALAGNTQLADSTLDTVLQFISTTTEGEITEVTRELL